MISEPVLTDESSVVFAFSRRPQNTSLFHGDVRDALANRKDFLSLLQIDYRDLVCAKQVHGSNVEYVREADKGRGALDYNDALAGTDALITDQIGVPLAIFTADCLSIFIYSPMAHAIAMVHAGWKGTKEDISGKTVKAMVKEFGLGPETLRVSFGPAIRSCCYEVGEEFRGYFPGAVAQNSGRYYLDLAAVNRKQLLESGVEAENISDSGICTSCRNKEFFSYRKEKEAAGRMISVIMLKKA